MNIIMTFEINFTISGWHHKIISFIETAVYSTQITTAVEYSFIIMILFVGCERDLVFVLDSALPEDSWRTITGAALNIYDRLNKQGNWRVGIIVFGENGATVRRQLSNFDDSIRSEIYYLDRLDSNFNNNPTTRLDEGLRLMDQSFSDSGRGGGSDVAIVMLANTATRSAATRYSDQAKRNGE